MATVITGAPTGAMDWTVDFQDPEEDSSAGDPNHTPEESDRTAR